MEKLLSGVVIAGISLVIAFAVFFPLSKSSSNPVPEIFGLTQNKLPVDKIFVPRLKEDTTDLQIGAESVLAIDMKTGKVLFEKNSQEFWPPASLNKLMTALVVANTLSLPQVVTIEEQDTEVAQPVMGLFTGEEITIHNLLRGMLIASANDSAAALARVVTGSEARFVELMNDMAARLGMDNTLYKNTTGFDEGNQLTTAADLSILVKEFLKYPELAEIVGTESMVVFAENENVRHWLTSTNKLLKKENIHGVKTGFTDLAEGNLVLLAANPKNNGENMLIDSYILTIVLGSGNREDDSLKLIEWVFESYQF